MTSRNPKIEPRFGDVFVWSGAPNEHVMYLRRGPSPFSDDWTGLDLERVAITEGYGSVSHARWLISERAEITVEMTCDHKAHRGSRLTWDQANNMLRGCTYRRVS